MPFNLPFVFKDMIPKTSAGILRKSKGHPRKPISSQGNKEIKERINDKFPYKELLSVSVVELVILVSSFFSFTGKEANVVLIIPKNKSGKNIFLNIFSFYM